MATSDYSTSNFITFSSAQKSVQTGQLPLSAVNAIGYNGSKWIIGGQNFVVTRTIWTYPDVKTFLDYVRVLNAAIKTFSNIKAALISQGASTYPTEIAYLTNEIISKTSYRDTALSAAAARYAYLKGLSYTTQQYTVITVHSMLISDDGVSWSLVEDNPFELYNQINTTTTTYTTSNGSPIIPSIVNDIKWNKFLSLWVAVGTPTTAGIWNGTSWSGTLSGISGPNSATQTFGTISVPSTGGGTSSLTGVTTLATSPDGLVWTPRGNGGFASYPFNKVAINSSLTIAIQNNNIITSPYSGVALYSSDCSSWFKLTGLGGILPMGVAWNGSLWVVVGQNNASSGAFSTNVSDNYQSIKTSSDGSTWTTRYISTYYNTLGSGTNITFATKPLKLFDVAWNGSYWLTIGKGGTAGDGIYYTYYTFIIRSYDGITWDIVKPYGYINTTNASLAWDGNNWIISFNNVFNFGGARYSYIDKYDNDLNGVSLRIDPNEFAAGASVYTGDKIPITTNLVLPIEGNNLATPSAFVSGFGSPTSMIYSYDNNTWITRKINGTANFSGSPTLNFTGVMWCSNQWVAIQDSVSGVTSDSITLSTNGLVWTYPSIYSNGTYKTLIDKPTGLAYNGSIIVIVGKGNIPVMASSDSGATWTSYSSPLPAFCIAWNGSNGSVGISSFAASSNGTQVITVTSTTGISTGKYVTIANATNISNNGTFLVTAVGTNTITCNNSLGVSQSESSSVTKAYTSLWVMGGSGPIATGGIATSVNGTSWTLSTNCPLYAVYGVAWNGYIWVAVGQGNTHSIATSVDGVNWFAANITTDPFANGGGSAVAWNRSLWVAVGYGKNTIATSVDGYTWTGRGKTTFVNAGTMIAYTGSNWIAGGTSYGSGTTNLASSIDGITWTPISAPISTPKSYGNKTISLPYTGYSSAAVLAAITGVTTTTATLTTSAVASTQQAAQTAADQAAAAAAAAAALATRNATKASAAGYVVEFLYWKQIITAAYTILLNPPAGNAFDSNIYNIDFANTSSTQYAFLDVQALYYLLNAKNTDILNYYTRVLDDTQPQVTLNSNLLAIISVRDQYNPQLLAFYEGSRVLYDSLITTIKTFFDNYSFSNLLSNYGFTSSTAARYNGGYGNFTSISNILSLLNTYWGNHISVMDSSYTTPHSVFTTPVNTVSITSISAPVNNIQTITVNAIGKITVDTYVTITNATDTINNVIAKVLSVNGNTFTISNSTGVSGTTATCQYVSYYIGVTNANLVGITDINATYSNSYTNTVAVPPSTFTITAFSAPSSGIQTITTSATQVVYVGAQVIISGNSNSGNNVSSKIVLSVTGNIFTISNSTGVASSSGASGYCTETSAISQISSNAPDLPTQYNQFNFSDTLYYYTSFNTAYKYKLQADAYYNNSISIAIKWTSAVVQTTTLSITTFSASSNGIQTITVSSIGNLQVNSVVTISGASNTLNNVSSPTLVLSINGNTFTISKTTGVSGTSQSATATYSTATVPVTTINSDFNSLYYQYYFTFAVPSSSTLGYTPYYTTTIPIKYFKAAYSNYTHPYTYPAQFSALYTQLQGVVNYADALKTAAINYANNRLSDVLVEKNYFETITREPYTGSTFGIQTQLSTLLNLLFYNDSNYAGAARFLDQIRLGASIYPDLYPLIHDVDTSIAIAEEDGCTPNINGWGGPTSVSVSTSTAQFRISNTYTLSITTFSSVSNGIQTITVTSIGNLQVNSYVTISGAANSGNNLSYFTPVLSINGNTFTISNPTGVSATSQTATLTVSKGGGERPSGYSIYATFPMISVIRFDSPDPKTSYQNLIIQDLANSLGSSNLKPQNDIIITGSSKSGNNVSTKIVAVNVFGGTITVYNPTGVPISGENATISVRFVVALIGTVPATSDYDITLNSFNGYSVPVGSTLSITGSIYSDNNVSNVSVKSVAYQTLISYPVPGAQQGFHGWDYYNNVYYAYQKLAYFKLLHTNGNYITFTEQPTLTITGASNNANNGSYSVVAKQTTTPYGFSIANSSGVSASNQSATGACQFLISYIGAPDASNYQIITARPFCLQIGGTVTITGSSSSANNVTNATITSVDEYNGTFTITNSSGVIDYSGKAKGTITISISTFGTPSGGNQFITTSNQSLVTGYSGIYPYSRGAVNTTWASFIDYSNTTTYDDIVGATNTFLGQMNTVTSNNGFTQSYMNTLRDNDISAIQSQYVTAGQTYLNFLSGGVANNIPSSSTLTITAFSTPSGSSQTLTVSSIGTLQIYTNLKITGAGNSSNNVTALITNISGNTVTITNSGGVAATSQTATGTYGDLIDFGSVTDPQNTYAGTLQSMVNTINTSYSSLLSLKNTGITSATNSTASITAFSAVGYNQNTSDFTLLSNGTYVSNSNIQTVTVSSIGNIIKYLTVRITGSSNSANNGIFTVLSVSGNTFTIPNQSGVSATSQSATATYSSVDYILTQSEGYVRTINTTVNSDAYKNIIAAIPVYRKGVNNGLKLVTRMESDIIRWTNMRSIAATLAPYYIGELSDGIGNPFIMSIPPTQTGYWKLINGTPFTDIETGTNYYTTFNNDVPVTLPKIDPTTIGAYSSTELYTVYNKVSYNGHVYTCIKDNSDLSLLGIKGVRPTVLSKWKVITYPYVTDENGNSVEADPLNFPAYDPVNYDPYQSTKFYSLGDLVSYQGYVYRSIFNFAVYKYVTNITPGDNSYYWLRRTYTVVKYNSQRVEADQSLFPTFSSLASAPAYNNSYSYSRGNCVTFGTPTKYYILTINSIGPQATTFPSTDFWREIIFPQAYDSTKSYRLGSYLSYQNNYYFLFINRQGKTITGITPGSYISDEDFWLQISRPVVQVGISSTTGGFVNVDSLGSYSNYVECNSSNNIPALNINDYPVYANGNKGLFNGTFIQYSGYIYEVAVQTNYTVSISPDNVLYWQKVFYPTITFAIDTVKVNSIGKLPSYTIDKNSNGVTTEYTPGLILPLSVTDYPQYSDTTLYNLNTIVSYPLTGLCYICVSDSPSGLPILNIPPTVLAHWILTDYPLVMLKGVEVPCDPILGLFTKLNELDYAVYENNWMYNVGNLVSYNGNVYECINVDPANVSHAITVTGTSPLSSTGYWTDTTPVNNGIIDRYYTPNGIVVWNPNQITVSNGEIVSTNAKTYTRGSFVVWKGLIYQCQQTISYPAVTYNLGFYYTNSYTNTGTDSIQDETTVLALAPPNDQLTWKLVDNSYFTSPSIPPFYSDTYMYGQGSVVMINDFPSIELPGVSIQKPYRLRTFQLTAVDLYSPVPYKYTQQVPLDSLNEYGTFQIGQVLGNYNTHGLPRYGESNDDPFALKLFASDLKRGVIMTILFPYQHIFTSTQNFAKVMADPAYTFHLVGIPTSFAQTVYNAIMSRGNTVISKFLQLEGGAPDLNSAIITDSIKSLLGSVYGNVVSYLLILKTDAVSYQTEINKIKTQYFVNPAIQKRIIDDPYPYLNVVGLAQDPPEMYFKDLGVGDIDEISQNLDVAGGDSIKYSEYERQFYYQHTDLIDDYNLQMQQTFYLMKYLVGHDVMAHYSLKGDAGMMGNDIILPFEYYDPSVARIIYPRSIKVTNFITGEYDAQDPGLLTGNFRYVDNGPKVNFTIGSISSSDITSGKVTFSNGTKGQTGTIGISRVDVNNVSDPRWLGIFNAAYTKSILIVTSNASAANFSSFQVKSVTPSSNGITIEYLLDASTGTLVSGDSVNLQYSVTGDLGGSNASGVLQSAKDDVSIFGLINSALLATNEVPKYTLPGGPEARIAAAITYETKVPGLQGFNKFVKGLVGCVAAGFQNIITAPLDGIMLVQLIGNLSATGKIDGEADRSTPFGTGVSYLNSVIPQINWPGFAEQSASLTAVKGSIAAYKLAKNFNRRAILFTLEELQAMNLRVLANQIANENNFKSVQQIFLNNDVFLEARTVEVVQTVYIPPLPNTVPVKNPIPPVKPQLIAVERSRALRDRLNQAANDIQDRIRVLEGKDPVNFDPVENKIRKLQLQRFNIARDLELDFSRQRQRISANQVSNDAFLSKPRSLFRPPANNFLAAAGEALNRATNNATDAAQRDASVRYQRNLSAYGTTRPVPSFVPRNGSNVIPVPDGQPLGPLKNVDFIENRNLLDRLAQIEADLRSASAELNSLKFQASFDQAQIDFLKGQHAGAISKAEAQATIVNQKDLKNAALKAEYDLNFKKYTKEMAAAQEAAAAAEELKNLAYAKYFQATSFARTAQSVADATKAALDVQNAYTFFTAANLTFENNVATLTYKKTVFTQKLLETPSFSSLIKARLPTSIVAQYDTIINSLSSALSPVLRLYQNFISALAGHVQASRLYDEYQRLRSNIKAISKKPRVKAITNKFKYAKGLPVADIAVAAYMSYSDLDAQQTIN
jgi:hypothetical protein